MNVKKRISFVFCGLLLVLTVSPALASDSPPNRLPQGGGVAYPAWSGQYWDNPDMTGEPVWEQSEIRIRFDWEDWRPIIGSRGEHVVDFPKDGFSARYVGTLIARYDQTYTFHFTTDEQARLKIRVEGDESWTTLVDAWKAHPRRTDQATFAMKPDTRYEVQIDYADVTGDAVCELRWESPSVPLEVIDYLGSTSIQASPHKMFADQFRGWIDNKAQRDENGWPTTDFRALLNCNRVSYGGRHLLSFQGMGEVHQNGATFNVGDQTFQDKLPKGEGYDPETNTTRATVDYNTNDKFGGIRFLKVVKTQRTADSPEGSGLTDVHLMKPFMDGSEKYHHIGEMANGEWREVVLPYVSYRVQTTGLCNDTCTWEDRMCPGTPFYQKGAQGWPEQAEGHPWGYGKRAWVYEHFIQMANEMGRDLYFCFPASTDDAWMDKFAKLVKYGSDGKEPYDGPVENPIYPPLNSNLRIILEHGNEMGWSAIQPKLWKADLVEHHKNNNDIWKAINFDGKIKDGRDGTGVFRYHGYRSAKMSRAMRKVYGDEGMGEIVRVMLFGQYQQPHQNTALQFVDDYFNNGAGDFVDDPMPVSDHFWGGGLAVYYGGENYWAESDELWLKDRSFEELSLDPGQAVLTPADHAWTFTGNAGVADYSDDKLPLFQSAEEAGTMALESGLAGYRFTTGDRPLFAYQLGRKNIEGGDKFSQQIALFLGDGQALPKSRTAVPIGGNARHFTFSEDELEADAWVYRHLEGSGWMTLPSFRPAIYRLEPNTTYLLVGTEAKGSTIPAPATVEATDEITIVESVTVNTQQLHRNGQPLKAEITTLPGTAGKAFPHLNLLFSAGVDLPDGTTSTFTLAPPDPRGSPKLKPRSEVTNHNTPVDAIGGKRLAFIAGQGTLTQEFEITEAGEYLLVMTGASTAGETKNTLRVTLGEHVVWDKLSLGENRKPLNTYNTYGTEYIALEPGTYTLTIEGLSENATDITYIDAVHIGTMDAYYGGPNASNFMGAGAATGQTDSKFAVATLHASAMAHNWGIIPTCYEGGNAVGGDWNGNNVLFWTQSKWSHPLTKVADINAANRWFSYGGYQFVHFYPPFDWDDFKNAENYVQWQASVQRASEWKWGTHLGL